MDYRARLARALLLGRILWQLGYVRVAYGALNGERQCSWAAVPDCLVRFSWGEYCGSWVTFAWRMALSMVRDSVRGLPCQIVSCASLGENIVAVGLRSRGVWRSQC